MTIVSDEVTIDVAATPERVWSLASDPGREFAFDTLFRGKVSTRWRYHVKSIPAGTRVIESYDVLEVPRWVRALRRIPGISGKSRREARRGMQVTLNRLKETAERNP